MLLARERRLAWLLGCGCLVVPLALIVVGYCWLRFWSPFTMQDEIQEVALSPDKAYKATFSYYDGLTFGYQRILLDGAGRHPFGFGRDEVVEMDESGISGIKWLDSRTLEVTYDSTKHRDSVWDASFVLKEPRWHDVRIVYKAVPLPDQSKSPDPR